MKQTNPGRHKEQRANIITRQHLKLKPEQASVCHIYISWTHITKGICLSSLRLV